MKFRTCKFNEIKHLQNEDDRGIVEFHDGKNMIWFCADMSGDIAGCVALRILGKNKGRLNHLYVKTAFRQGGVASFLTHTLIRYAMTLGMKSIETTSKSSLFTRVFKFQPTGIEYKCSGRKLILEL